MTRESSVQQWYDEVLGSEWQRNQHEIVYSQMVKIDKPMTHNELSSVIEPLLNTRDRGGAVRKRCSELANMGFLLEDELRECGITGVVDLTWVVRQPYFTIEEFRNQRTLALGDILNQRKSRREKDALKNSIGGAILEKFPFLVFMADPLPLIMDAMKSMPLDADEMFDAIWGELDE